MLIVTLTRIHLQTNTHTRTPAAFTNKQTAFRPQLLHLLSPLNSCNQLTRTSSTEGSSGPCRLCIPIVSVSPHYSPRCWYAIRSETSSASVDHAMDRTCQLLPAVLLLSWCTLPSYACQLVKLCDIPVAQSMLVVTLTRIHIQTRAHTQCHTHTHACCIHTRIAFRPPQLLHLLTPFNSCNQLTRTSSTEGSSGPCRLCIPIVSVSHH